MKKSTRKVLVAASAVGAVGLIGALIFWPKKAAAATTETKLPAQLDANLSEGQKKDVANLIYNVNDPKTLTEAGMKYESMGAPLAAHYLYTKALSFIAGQLDASAPKDDPEILLPLYVWTDPVEIQSAALVLQSKGWPLAAKLVMDRAVELSKLAA